MDDTTYYTYSTSNVNSADAAALWPFLAVIWIIAMAVAVITIVSMWKLFTKAGKPGWAAIVPIYNNIVMLEIVGRPLWWVVLYFVPFANIVVTIMVALETAKVFGKDTVFGVLMILFPVPMYPILAFSKNTQYLGPIAHPESQYGYATPTQTPGTQPGPQPGAAQAPQAEQPQPPQPPQPPQQQ